MKSKVQENLNSAQILINNQHFTASIHCSYYAVLEYMKYMLANTDRNPISFEVQESNSGDSSHEYILGEIIGRIDHGKKAKKNFSQGVRFLKKERVDADYTQRKFSDIDALDCKQKAEGLITNLKTYFGNI